MKKILIYLTAPFIFTACESPKNLSDVQGNASGEITVGQNFVINRPMAVLVLPTEESLQETQEEIGPEKYSIYYDDGASLINDANTVIENLHLESVERLNNEIITFATSDGQLYDVDLRDKAFVTLLFNGKEAPKELFSEHLETDDSVLKYMR